MDITNYFDEILDLFLKNNISELIENKFIYSLIKYDGHFLLHGSRLYDNDESYYTFDSITEIFDEILRLSDIDTVEYFTYIVEKIETCKEIIELQTSIDNISFQ